jgi:hypothetical protein
VVSYCLYLDYITSSYVSSKEKGIKVQQAKQNRVSSEKLDY